MLKHSINSNSNSNNNSVNSSDIVKSNVSLNFNNVTTLAKFNSSVQEDDQSFLPSSSLNVLYTARNAVINKPATQKVAQHQIHCKECSNQ